MESTLTGAEHRGATEASCSLLEIRGDNDAGSALQLGLIGEVDMAVTDELAQDLGRLVELRRPVRLDLSCLRFIDGRGLATVVSAIRQARAAGCAVEVDPAITPAVELVVALSGVASTLWPETERRALRTVKRMEVIGGES